MSNPSSQMPSGPRRAGPLDAEGELLLQIPGRPLRRLGAPRRFTLLAVALWLFVVSAGLGIGWMLRGLT